MWVKVCGLRTEEAVLAAVGAGADAVGFVFAAGRRQVSPDNAQRMIAGLPEAVGKVGVFVDASAAEVWAMAARVGLTHVQLHGAEPPEILEQLSLPVIKAFRVKDRADLRRLPLYRAAAGLLLDPFVPGEPGGTGRRLDLSLFRRAEASLRAAGVDLSEPDEPLTPGHPKLILAGGLDPENVGAAIAEGRPGGVDVSSGVETGGSKDIVKIRKFIEMVKGGRR
ncbi:MAG TPA: phosphoribosylanthranilate isomerase [Bacillota bacterium]|jgi:phosphoribosylanthranilate isomerase